MPSLSEVQHLLGTSGHELSRGCMFALSYPTGRFLQLEGEIERVLGVSKAVLEHEGMGFFPARTHPDDTFVMQQLLMTISLDCAQAYLNGTPKHGPFRVSYRLRHPDDSWHVIESVTYILSFQPDGMFNEGLAFLFDITDEQADQHRFVEALQMQHRVIERFMERLMHQYADEYRRLLGDKAPILMPITKTKDPQRDLTQRELEVLKLLAGGRSTKEIASDLSITVNTVETHRKNLFKKFVVRNLAELIREASKSYWLY